MTLSRAELYRAIQFIKTMVKTDFFMTVVKERYTKNVYRMNPFSNEQISALDMYANLQILKKMIPFLNI